MIPTIYNNKPPAIPTTTIEVGYRRAKVRYSSVVDYDLSAVGGWVRRSIDPKSSASYTQNPFNTDSRIHTFPALTPNTSYVATLSYLDDFVTSAPDLIQAEYLKATPETLSMASVSFSTIIPISINSVTISVTESVVGNPFATVTLNTTGQADLLVVESLDTNNPQAVWVPVVSVKPSASVNITMLGGSYQLRYSSVKKFSDGDEDITPVVVYPTTVVVESGLSAPPEVSNISLAAFKNKTLTSTYDLRVGWNFPADLSSQNRKRNFTVAILPNPGLSTNYSSLNWSSSITEVAVSSAYVFNSFPYKIAYVVRIGVVGWGVEQSEFLYVPIYISKDGADSNILGYLAPSEATYASFTKIQIDDEFIRAYKTYDPINPANNVKVFEVDALTGNVVIGTAGGVYGGGSVLTTAPFIFDSVSKKLQISGRTITDQIESASYVMSWIDTQPPSLRTAGKAAYAANAPGIWMGYVNPSTFMFDLGDSTNYIRWNGTNLTISGTVQIGLDGRTLGQAQKQIFIYRRDISTPPPPTGGTFNAPVPPGWSNTVPSGIDDVYMCSRLFTTDGAPPQDSTWSSPSLFSPGAAGGSTASYTWIKYADDVIGTGLTDSPTGKAYIGIAVNKSTPVESTNSADYAWSLLTGQGVPGVDGTDGTTKYTWIKYSEFATGSPSMSNSPDSSTLFIGISSNRDTEVESDVPTDYTWSRFKGDAGVPGSVTFKSTVFIRFTGTPTTPTTGSFASPVPAGWSDGVPSGSLQLWASTRVFSQDGLAPQQSTWTTPVAMTSTSTLEIQYSSLLVSPSNPTSTPGNWSATASESTVWLAQRNSVNGVFGSWQISKIKGEAGAGGTDGTDAKGVFLSASSMVVTFLANNSQNPEGQFIQFAVNRQNVTAATTWSAVDNNGVNVTGLLYGLTNTVSYLDGSNFASRKFIKVTATAEGYSDSVTVSKVQDGNAGVDSTIGILTNEAHTVAADKLGVVSSWLGVAGNFLVYKGAANITGDCTFSVVSSTNATGSINSSGVYSVTAMSADQGSLTLRATVTASGLTIDKIFSVTKSRAGVTGSRGAGRYSVSFVGPTATITNSMATAAAAACPEGIPVSGDVVTLYDSGNAATIPVTIIYNTGVATLAASWQTFLVKIDGNLLVNGSVAADKINVNDLYAQSANITGTLQVGSGSTYTVIDGIRGGITATVAGNTVFSATPSGGFLQGKDIAAGSIKQSSLSPELQSWISSLGGGGGGPITGGSQSYQAQLESGIYTLGIVECAAGIVQLSIAYGGSGAVILSMANPGLSNVAYRIYRNGTDITGYTAIYGTTESITGFEPGVPHRYYVTMPAINITLDSTVPAGNQTFGIQFLVTRATGTGGYAQWTAGLGSFSFGAFQPTSGGSGGGGSTTLDGLTDVSTVGAVSGNTLIFNGSTWAPGAGGGGGSVLTFGSYLTGNSYNGSSAVTLGVNASTLAAGSTLVARDGSGNFSAGTITAALNGNAVTSSSLATARSISSTGDVGWSVSFKGDQSVSGTATLTNTTVSPGTYGSSSNVPVITVDSKGRVTSLSTSAIPAAPAISSLSAAGTTFSVNNSYGVNIQSAQSDAYLYFRGGANGAIYANTTGMHFQVAQQGSNYLAMTTTGIYSNYNHFAPDFFASSDIRVKKDLKVIDNAMEKVKELTGYTYLRTDREDAASSGIIAQDLQKVLPSAVAEGSEGILTVNHGSVIGLLVQAIKEQQATIDLLLAKVGGV